MDEEISIIDSKTRSEKLKNFFIKNKKFLILFLLAIIVILISFYSFQIYKNNQKVLLSDKYNSAVIKYSNGDISKTFTLMKDIVTKKDSTYSPLALYFIIDNKLIQNQSDINDLFNILIDKTSLEIEIKNLIIYKKALFNADTANENDLLEILNPLINSKSIWKSHALYLIAEYFYSKGEYQKAREFYEQIISVINANQDILNETKIRLNRDLGE
tara:strand:+ start:96 stop:740 length:645 start_codon:yes stop_codon:yes gene_type:complete